MRAALFTLLLLLPQSVASDSPTPVWLHAEYFKFQGAPIWHTVIYGPAACATDPDIGRFLAVWRTVNNTVPPLVYGSSP